MKEKLSLLFKIIIVIVSGIGLYLNFNLLSFRNSIIYFTIQSNLLCFIYFLALVILTIIKKLKKNDFYYISKGMVTMAITITFIVYHFVLVPEGGLDAYVGHELENNFVHLFTPLLVIFDYIIFGEKGHLKKSYPFIWNFVLVAYVIFNVVYVLIGGRFANGSCYPYPCMNIDNLGLIRTSINCLIIYVAFLVYGYIVLWLDNKIALKLKH